MSSFLQSLGDILDEEDDALLSIPDILDAQAGNRSFGASRAMASQGWAKQRTIIDEFLRSKSEYDYNRVIRALRKIVDVLDMYAPALKGLHEVHAYTCEKLENLLFDVNVSARQSCVAAYLYGQVVAMSSVTAEALAPAVDNLLLRGDPATANLAIAVLLGAERSNDMLFENNLAVLLRQVQVAAFSGRDSAITRDALLCAMRVYSPTEKASSCQVILQATHAILAASLELCHDPHSRTLGVEWVCLIVQHAPMLLRIDLRGVYPKTCDAVAIFKTLTTGFDRVSDLAQVAQCGALPVLTTWETSEFCSGGQVEQAIALMTSMPFRLRSASFRGLGGIATVILDRFEPFLQPVGILALNSLQGCSEPKEQIAAQQLLGRLLAATGPLTLDLMMKYLHCSPSILLQDIALLERIATLLPNLAWRVVHIFEGLVDDLLEERPRSYEQIQVLHALSVFPLEASLTLAQKTQSLVIWSLDEDMGRDVVLAAMQLAVNPEIAKAQVVRNLTVRSAKLLLSDDPHIVHSALSILSNPTLAGALDEQSCSMILLALHQSIEPSIQIVAAKLLTHLATAHKAIVQPLAWSHIRQSLSLMDFLQTVEPTRAIIEACIISNLLPALPPDLHKKYVGPVKQLILSGLQKPTEGPTLSLIFQGLANLAEFEGWDSVQQSELAMDLVDMSQEVPKESQHAALNAISRLLSNPQEGLDVYSLLLSVHAVFGGRSSRLDYDLKALVSGIYGHLGTVERNPVISRDSRAAINRENSNYTPKTVLLSQVAEIRDKYGVDNQTHINWLIAKNLLAVMGPAHKADDERTLVLEAMSALGILQSAVFPTLIPDLPLMVMRELRRSLGSSENKKDSTPIAAADIYLAGALHVSPLWLVSFWAESADLLVEGIKAGEAVGVLNSLDVILDAVVDY